MTISTATRKIKDWTPTRDSERIARSKWSEWRLASPVPVPVHGVMCHLIAPLQDHTHHRWVPVANIQFEETPPLAVTSGAYPSLHLNGSSPVALRDDLIIAAVAVLRAQDALRNTAPHGRDYYPQGTEALVVAEGAYRKRFEALGGVYTELMDQAEYIQRTIDERERERRALEQRSGL